jgi:hypothetical protein
MRERVWHVYAAADGRHDRSVRGVGSTAARLEPTYDFCESSQARDKGCAARLRDETEKPRCSAWMRGQSLRDSASLRDAMPSRRRYAACSVETDRAS